jgi:hypothetical protein
MHCTIMPFAHVWLVSSIGHVYVELELEVPTEQVQVEEFTNLVDSRQAPMHLTIILEFILSYYTLIMILGCALGYRSWLDTLVALRQLFNLSL